MKKKVKDAPRRKLQNEIDALRKQVIKCHENNDTLYDALMRCTCPASRGIFKYNKEMLESAVNSLSSAALKEKKVTE